MRRIAFLILSICVSLILLFLVLRDVPLEGLWDALRQADIFWLILALGMVFLSLITRGIRWRGLLANRLSLRDAVLIFSLTMLINQLPFRLGEVLRTLLAKQRNISLVTAATSILVEKLLDLVLVVLLVLWSIPQVPNMDKQVSLGAFVLGGLAIIAFISLLLLARYPEFAHGLIERLNKIPFLTRLPLARLFDNLLEGLNPLTQWGTLAHALLWTVISWAVSFMSLYACLRALNFEDSAILASSLGLGMTSLSIVFPATVASIGLIEGAIKLMGSLLQYEELRVTALGFLYHGISVLGYLLLGLPAAWLLGISWGAIFNPVAENTDETLGEN